MSALEPKDCVRLAESRRRSRVRMAPHTLNPTTPDACPTVDQMTQDGSQPYAQTVTVRYTTEDKATNSTGL